jgi:hypothetical protein
MKGTYKMGKVKDQLIDTELEDQTDPRDTFSPPESDEPSEVDHAMYELQKAINILKRDKPYGYYDEIDQAQAELAKLVAEMDKPF